MYAPGDEGLLEAIRSANFAQTAFGVRTAWENRIQRYRETAEVMTKEVGSHLDDTVLDNGGGCLQRAFSEVQHVEKTH